MAKEVKLPAELEAAAEKMLDLHLYHVRAKDMFRLALIRAALARSGGVQMRASAILGMTKQQFYGLKETLETRLAE